MRCAQPASNRAQIAIAEASRRNKPHLWTRWGNGEVYAVGAFAFVGRYFEPVGQRRRADLPSRWRTANRSLSSTHATILGVALTTERAVGFFKVADAPPSGRKRCCQRSPMPGDPKSCPGSDRANQGVPPAMPSGRSPDPGMAHSLLTAGGQRNELPLAVAMRSYLRAVQSLRRILGNPNPAEK